MAHGDWKDMFHGVQTNDHQLVEYYIHSGIDLNYQHPEFSTSPLIESIRCNHTDMTALLLKNGASPLVKEADSNKTPMSIAKELGNNEAIRLLNLYLEAK